MGVSYRFPIDQISLSVSSLSRLDKTIIIYRSKDTGHLSTSAGVWFALYLPSKTMNLFRRSLKQVVNLSCYLCFDSDVKDPFSWIIIEGFPENKNSFFTGRFDRKFSVVVAGDNAVHDFRVGRVRLVSIEGLNSTEYGQTLVKRKLPNCY